MKIHSIKYDTSHKQGYHQNPAITEKGYSAGLCENNNRGYNVAFSGSRASKISEAAAKVFKPILVKKSNINELHIADETVLKVIENRILNEPKKYKHGLYGQYPKFKENFDKSFLGRILGSKYMDKSTDFFNGKPSVAQAFMALIVAGILRPATNIAMASKEDREDSMHAASHAIASAVIGYVVSATVLAPFNDAFKDIEKKCKRHLKGKQDLLHTTKIGARTIETSPRWGKMSQICKFSFDSFILGLPKAALTIALIPPILKYVFGIEKKSKKQAPLIQDNMSYTKNFIDKPAFATFKGGVK